MQPNYDFRDREGGSGDAGAAVKSGNAGAQGGCYGIQVLVAGRHKPWRDEVSAQVRRAGCSATSVESAVDALTVLVLGLPVDVLVTDVDLHGDLCCSRLAAEARALRPNLCIVLAGDPKDSASPGLLPPDAVVVPPSRRSEVAETTIREALATCAP